jgi:hypothetical protein
MVAVRFGSSVSSHTGRRAGGEDSGEGSLLGRGAASHAPSATATRVGRTRPMAAARGLRWLRGCARGRASGELRRSAEVPTALWRRSAGSVVRLTTLQVLNRTLGVAPHPRSCDWHPSAYPTAQWAGHGTASVQFERFPLRRLSTPGENRTLLAAENRTLGTGGDEPQGVWFSFDLEVLFRGEEAEPESPELRVRHSSVC